ncbi:MAG: hypothetical protein J6S47_02865 [Eubacteriaceae bacterium]|nr:hypothetical protein [Eubacteriaceae bacterium]
MSEFRKVITKPGEIIDFETVFEENPYLRTGVPTKKGTVERVDYTTDVYEDGKTYSKYCYVYLPYGYDPENKDKKYNVLYFQHGNTCEPSIFAIGGNKPMIDMLFESGEIDPVIMVSVTFYMDPMGECAYERLITGRAAAGDGGWDALPGNYYREVVEDIVPTVEMKYNTYLTAPTEEAVKASRDHRAFSGYSRGGAMTWRMWHHCFEYFRYFCPMSAATRGDLKKGTPMSDEQVIDYITYPVKKNPQLPFFLFVSNGGPEDQLQLNKHMKFLTHQDCFSYGPDPAKNNIYYAVSDFYHTDFLVPYYYWNSLKVLFKGV